MIAVHGLRIRLLLSAFVGVVFVLALLSTPSAVLGAGWSQPVTIAASLPSPTPNVFAFNPAGNELWVAAPPVSPGALVQVAQRSFGGAWSSFTTIATIHSVALVTVKNLSVSFSASNNAAAAWSVGGGVQITLRTPAGVWQAPVSFAPAGGVSSLLSNLDAQGNGVAVWSRLTSTASVVEAVTWNAVGAFGNVVQLSSSSQGAFQPELAVNEAGTAVVVWLAAAPLDPSSPYQVESVTRPAGGSWSAVMAASPVVPQTYDPQVALDGSGNAVVVWEQGATVNNYLIYAAKWPAGGAWGAPTRIEPSDWYMTGQTSVTADAAGNFTASWVVDSAGGSMFVHTASLPTGGAWGPVTNLGGCNSNGGSLCLTPPVVSARDGSITVVGWSAYGGAANPNVAVRLGSGQWVPMNISGNPQISNVTVTNNAIASAVWAAPNGVKYHHAIDQSDYK